MGFWKWFKDSQFPRSSQRGQDQDDRRRGFNDAQAGRPRRGSGRAYAGGYAAGSLPTATALPTKRDE